MTDYFNPILSEYISAFRKGYSCQSILLKMVEDWKHALDSGNIVYALMIDLSKAFDTLPHNKFLCKLKQYGFSDSAEKLMNSYLSNRKQRVVLNACKSSWSDITCGVPQGSILGPLIFNIYINDMYYNINECSLYNYADDNTLGVISKTVIEVHSKMQIEANNMMNWFNANGMNANPSKFQSMLMGDTSTLRISIDNHEIENTTEVKSLGIIFDYKLKFDSHLKEICRSAARQLNALRRLSSYLDENTRLVIYKSFILANFNYCPIIWHFCGVTNSRKIESIQKRALRFVFKDYTSTYDQLLQKASTSTLYLTRLRNIAIESFKIMHNIGPSYLFNLLQEKEHTHNLRSDRNVNQPKCNTVSYGTNSFMYKGAKIWNNLPNELKNCISLEQFKK